VRYLAYAQMTEETKEVAELDKEIREMELELARLRSKYPLEDVS
jgi:ribosomal protein L29